MASGSGGPIPVLSPSGVGALSEMYLAPEGQELEIADAARSYLADAIPLGRLHQNARADLPIESRREMAQLGWFGLAVPEQQGGSGLSEVEHVLFFREVGRLCGPIDVLAQCLAANAAGSADLRAALLAGDEGVALAVPGRDGLRILGSIDARHAIIVEPQSAAIIAIDGIDAELRPGLDRTDSIRLARSLPDAVDRYAGSRIWTLGQLATAAMLVGIAEAALDLIVDYAKVRETFGRKIGAWQAVRHPCADMAVRLEGARAQLWFAAAAAREGRADAPAHITAAKHLANEAAHRNADSNIQLHGGIGVTEEHGAHVLLKRAMLLNRLFGARQELLANLLNARLED